jgi:RimJ/RimL family protein N-acetyltransferase
MIRLIEATDADFAWMMRGDAVSDRGLMSPPGGVDAPFVLEHVRAMAQRLAAEQGHTDSWMIVAGDEVVGLCGYKRMPSHDGAVDIGYGIAASRQRRGYAREAVAALVMYAKNDPRVATLIAETAVNNRASQRVLGKNGFQFVCFDDDIDDGARIVRWRADVHS